MTLSRRLVAVLVLALLVPFVTRGMARLILTAGNVWTTDVLPALTAAAPVGIPVLGSALLFVALARFDTRR